MFKKFPSDDFVPFHRRPKKEQDSIIEETHRRRERFLLRQERNERIATGVIVPASRMGPTPIVKTNDGWQRDQWRWAIGLEASIILNN